VEHHSYIIKSCEHLKRYNKTLHVSVPTVWGYPQPTIIKNKTIKPQRKAARLDRIPGRLVRGQLDGEPRTRSNSDSYEAPPTGTPRPRLVPYKQGTSTALRLARGSFGHQQNSDSRNPGSKRSTHSIYLPETKVRAFNASTCYHLPTWLQP
jgi:hypothetical protein